MYKEIETYFTKIKHLVYLFTIRINFNIHVPVLTDLESLRFMNRFKPLSGF